MPSPRTQLSQNASDAAGADLNAARSRAVDTILIALISETKTNRLDCELATLVSDTLQAVDRLGGCEAVAAVVDAVVEELAGRALWSAYAGRFAHGRHRWRSLLAVIEAVAPEALVDAPWRLQPSWGDPDA